MTSAAEPRVSILTPAYNGGEFLAECIESVLAQTYRNWDYTIVNNCSTDNTLEVAERYAAADPRIRIHDNTQFLRAIPNHSLAFGLISEESKYGKMVFADDWLYPECIERMVEVAEAYPSVGIVGAYGLRGTEVMWTGLPYPSTIISGRDICRRLLIEHLHVFGTATSHMIRSDLVRARQPFYNESNLHADMEVCVELLKTCDFGFVHQVLTYTRERADSLTTVTRKLNTLAPGFLHDLVAHGRDYLTREEWEDCLEANLSSYYGFLARCVVERRDERFWEYHRRKLTEEGVGFDRVRLAKAVAGKVLNTLLNPKQTFDELMQGKSIFSSRAKSRTKPPAAVKAGLQNAPAEGRH
jgi:glycosyltransferase involved in cell wall biosynthesis